MKRNIRLGEWVLIGGSIFGEWLAWPTSSVVTRTENIFASLLMKKDPAAGSVGAWIYSSSTQCYMVSIQCYTLVQ